jgi:hypothetical protein
MILYSRWKKQYRIVRPPSTPKKTPSEAKEAKEAKKQGVRTCDYAGHRTKCRSDGGYVS